MFCYHCGKKVPENAKFCPECGTPCGKNEIFSCETAPVDESVFRDAPPAPQAANPQQPVEKPAVKPAEPVKKPAKKRMPVRQFALPFAAGAVFMLLLVILVSGMGKSVGGNAPAASGPAQSEPEPEPEPPEVNPLGEAPDLQAFSGGKLAVLDESVGVGHTEVTYAADWNKKFLKEYVTLLREEYGFERREYRYDEEQDSYLYSFDFTGSADVGTFLGVSELNNPAEISFSVWAVFAEDNWCEIRVAYADGIRYEDTGDRTAQEMDDLSETTEESFKKGSWFQYLMEGRLEDYCFTCRGSGKLPCTRCGGAGGAYGTESDAPDGRWAECGLCGGTGRIDCPDCDN